MSTKRLREILELAKGKKAAGRRSAVQNLLSVYNNASILAEITRNSANSIPGTVSWKEILHGVHHIVTSEGDRTPAVHKKNASQLFLQTVKHASNLLNSSDLVSFVLQVLSTEALNFCHFTYMSVLNADIIAVPAYRNNISREQWQELLMICICCYQNQNSPVKKENVLEVIQGIVQYGCSLSHLIVRARKLLPFIAEVFEDMKSNDALIDSALKLANTVCREIATEGRLMLCSFGETMIPALMNLKKSYDKYDLLLILVQVHHPKGAVIGDEISYAVDAAVWKTILHNMCNMIIQESKSQDLSESFIELGCEVFKQIVEDPLALEKITSQVESQSTESSKRRRTSSQNGKLINMITGCTLERAWPMLQIFARLFKQYPTTLKANEFTLFLKTLSSLLMQCSSFPKVLDSLCNLGIALVDVEKNLGSQESDGNNKLFWSEILDTVTSYLSTNENQEAAHRLLRYLIENEKVMNLSSLLKTYVTKTISWSHSSLQSLLVVCRYTTLPESLSDLNMNLSSAQNVASLLATQLLQWASNIPWEKLVTLDSVENISELLIRLTLKSWSKDLKKSFKKYIEPLNPEQLYYPNNLSEIEKCYLAMEYKIDIFRKTGQSHAAQTIIEQSKQLYMKDNLHVLYSLLEEICKPADNGDGLRTIIVKCALLARIISDLNEMNLFQNGLEDFPLMPLFQKFLKNIFHILSENDLAKFRHKALLHVMKVLRILFQTTPNRSVNKIIVHCTPVEALQNIHAFLQSRDGSDIRSKARMLQATSDVDFSGKDIKKEQANKNAERISVVKTLALYCCTATEGVMLEVQEELLCSLLNSDRYDFKSYDDTELVLMILEIVIKSESSMHTESSIVAVMNLLIESFQYLYKDQTSARRMLSVIPKVLTIAMKLDQNVDNLVKIIVYFHNLLKEKNEDIKKTYGPSMYLEFLKCLEKLILLDPLFKFSNHSESIGERVPIIEYLLEYVNSPFYTVRLETARCVYSAFASHEIDHGWKISFFDKLKIVLMDAFITNRKLDNNEKPDERMTRVTSTLYVISAVIYGSDLLKCQALFTLIYLASQKEIKAKTVQKVLYVVTKGQETIVESNLDYLLMQWWHKQQSFDKFPWDLTPCANEDIFYVNYMHVLLPVLIKTGNISQAVGLCNQQGLNFEREFERSFPNVIVWLLPKVSKNSDSVNDKAKDILRNLETNQKEFRSVRRFIDLVYETLDQIIVLLMKELHDEKHFAEMFSLSTTFPESGFMRLTASNIYDCLLFMEINFFASGKLIHYLAAERRDVLQKVLLKLARNIYDSSGEHKLKAFHQFIFFCNTISKEIKHFLFREISSFIIRDISYTLLCQIDEEDDQVAEVACKYSCMFLQLVLPEKSEVVKEIFIPTIKTLTRRVCKDEKSSALQALRFLIADKKDLFIDAISSLDFFPNKVVFDELIKIHSSLRYSTRESRSLETEVEHFLNVSSDKNFSGSESIVRLGDQLSSRRNELKEHYKKLESLRGFAEDCTSSKLHRLISRLAKLMKSSDPEVSQEAAKCLGLLGPGNLATMILLPDQIQRRENSNRFEILTHRVLILLSDLVNDKNIELREASADALYVVLSSVWGQNLMKKNYLDDFECAMDSTEMRLSIDHILPFLSRSNINTPAEMVHLEICSDLKDDAWIEISSGSYSAWIMKFSCIIADCFRNFYIKRIVPIFNLSVQFCEKMLPWMVNVLFGDPKLVKEDIIREANVKIGDPDAIHGCGSMHLLNPSSRIQHYVDLKQWDKAMLMQDIELSCGIDSTRDMLHVLQNTGLYFLLNHFMPSINDESMNNCNKDYKFECAWRLGDWSLLDPKQTTYGSQPNFNSLNCERNQSYYSYHYEALKCLNDNDEVGVKRALYSARNCVIKYLRNISLESCKAMYPMLSQLQMLREIEEWASTKPSEYANRLFDWHHHNYIKNNDFEYVEPLFSQRIAICKMKQSLEGDAFVKSVLPDIYLELIQYAEERGHFRVATRALDSLAKENNLSQEMKNKLYYLEAHLDWSQNNQHIGQFLLNLLMNDNSASPSLRAQALCVFGNWVGKTESGNPQVIIKKYYQESIKTFLSINEPTSEDLKNLYETQAALARFSDMQYRQITDFIKSPLFKTIQSCAEMSNVSPDDYSNNAELRRAIGIYQRQSKNDVAELENFEKDKNTYLLLALEYYLRTLEQSKDHDFLIFRVVSLWLDNTHHEHFNKILNKYLPKIASYKFVPLIPQLAPHMNLANTQFSSKINEILKKCALEHPHHTLPILLALKNLNGDSEFSPCQVSSRDESKPRMKAATKLINQLLQTKIRPIVEEMTQLSRALVMLAYLQVQKKRPNEKHVIPLNQVIYKIKNLNNTIIPTMALSVRTNGNYDNIIGIREYKSNFITVGGVNAPKKIECVGTDGIIRRQLVKGQDDMRQDAVMQQVFTVINSLLRANKETKERKLNIRTYKVVPLTQRSGVLEWCENTLPIANILIGIDRNSGIHKKYYPENYTGLQCRKKMEAALKESNEVKLKTFLECCENMHPAFHHFFTEKYLSPEVWFERRLTYTRSIATNSIVGYVLSVGDRHLQNILIDQTTAEVIHIDFGIAFEQGKLLSVPETVPFRLTRDIEVPMGLSGVEGVMRRCCEQTLKLLQEQREIIVTLLQVLLYDPLFTWSISSTKAHRLQSSTLSESSDGTDGSVEINKFANRALLTVQQKLQGIEEGVTLSVEGQVERLIQQARDPSNLCLIFQGWQAYL
ncbi:serine-protein kinase ATM-like isoform X2 [Belonocnema kinseyi]|uniref:serine-protein kinase ATM-like isoform X2 n=1 Tax=Belonocnema kinseyi TaxID=2817044 RepID=UPI00143DF972|nr:serine-protein kinase ATM-like isoform X2 [Belonocnema kinseyi]